MYMKKKETRTSLHIQHMTHTYCLHRIHQQFHHLRLHVLVINNISMENTFTILPFGCCCCYCYFSVRVGYYSYCHRLLLLLGCSFFVLLVLALFCFKFTYHMRQIAFICLFIFYLFYFGVNVYGDYGVFVG